jgi:hypothetical protein
MNVYTYFDSSEHADSNQPMLLRLWVRSWSARGWSPRILTVRNAERHPSFSKLKHDHREMPRLAQETAKVKWLCPMSTMNFGMTPGQYRRLGLPKVRHFLDNLDPDPHIHPLVDFPNVHDADVIEHCGRPL